MKNSACKRRSTLIIFMNLEKDWDQSTAKSVPQFLNAVPSYGWAAHVTLRTNHSPRT